MTYATEMGTLSAGPSRASGKMVDEWTYRSPHPSMHGNISMTVEVSMMRRDRALYFRAHGACLDQPIDHSDIDVLRELVQARLRYLDGGRLGIVWEDWLEVKVSSYDSESYDIGRAQLCIEVSPLKRGVHPDTGEVFTLAKYGHAMPFPKQRKIDDPVDNNDQSLQNGNWHTETPANVALIPATSENVAALADIRARLRLLRERMSDVLAQESISTTLADLSAHFPLLK